MHVGLLPVILKWNNWLLFGFTEAVYQIYQPCLLDLIEFEKKVDRWDFYNTFGELAGSDRAVLSYNNTFMI